MIYWRRQIYIGKKLVQASVIGFLSGSHSGVQISILAVLEIAYLCAFLGTRSADDKVVWILEVGCMGSIGCMGVCRPPCWRCPNARRCFSPIEFANIFAPLPSFFFPTVQALVSLFTAINFALLLPYSDFVARPEQSASGKRA